MAHLEGLRSEIDALDRQLLDLLARRFEVVTRVAGLKAAQNLPARIEQRIVDVIRSREDAGLALGMPSGAAAAIWSAIVEQSCLHEEALLGLAPAIPIERSRSTS